VNDKEEAKAVEVFRKSFEKELRIWVKEKILRLT
jgi:hypothetical protein